MTALAALLRKLPALKELLLGNCGIRDEGVASLVDNLGKNDFKALEHLGLEGNLITDVGCAKLIAALKTGFLPEIRSLYESCIFDLDFTRISLHASGAACAALDAALKARLADREA